MRNSDNVPIRRQLQRNPLRPRHLERPRRGDASEMVQTLVEHAFTFPGVKRIIAHTTEANPASIAVLLRCGFHRAGAGREIGTLRFERSRIARA
jgi:[ribosomal protein S5]-alanine N-acetyltransferase